MRQGDIRLSDIKEHIIRVGVHLLFCEGMYRYPMNKLVSSDLAKKWFQGQNKQERGQRAALSHPITNRKWFR